MKRNIFLGLSLAMIAFIWIHSCMPTVVSSQESGSFLKMLQPFLEIFAGRGNVTDHMVRKLAHFAEYAMLGCFLTHTMVFSAVTGWKGIGIVVLTGWLTAFLDETIQIFSGRGPLISDVWLDLSGVCFAVVLVFAAHWVRGRR